MKLSHFRQDSQLTLVLIKVLERHLVLFMRMCHITHIELLLD